MIRLLLFSFVSYKWVTPSQHDEKTKRIFLGVAGEFAKIQFRKVSHHVSHVHSRGILDLAEYPQRSENSENEHFIIFIIYTSQNCLKLDRINFPFNIFNKSAKFTLYNC